MRNCTGIDISEWEQLLKTASRFDEGISAIMRIAHLNDQNRRVSVEYNSFSTYLTLFFDVGIAEYLDFYKENTGTWDDPLDEEAFKKWITESFENMFPGNGSVYDVNVEITSLDISRGRMLFIVSCKDIPTVLITHFE